MMNSTLQDPAVVIPPRGGTAVRRAVTGAWSSPRHYRVR
jgi:hypothetical protein